MNEELLNKCAKALSDEAGSWEECRGRNAYTIQNLTVEEAKAILIKILIKSGAFSITPTNEQKS